MKKIVAAVNEKVSKLHLLIIVSVVCIVLVVCLIVVFWQLNSIKTELRAVQRGQEALYPSIVANRPRTGSWTIDSLKSDIASVKFTASKLKSTVSRINSTVSSIESDVSSIKSDVSGPLGLEWKVDRLESRVSRLE